MLESKLGEEKAALAAKLTAEKAQLAVKLQEEKAALASKLTQQKTMVEEERVRPSLQAYGSFICMMCKQLTF